MKHLRKNLFTKFILFYSLVGTVLLLNSLASVYIRGMSLTPSPIPLLDTQALTRVTAVLGSRTNPQTTAPIDITNYHFGKPEPF